ncbi:MAG TPA: hypothetical protein VGL94_05750 [Ktedonobacteraceae bacterium]|jgi:hypothetical protein
MPPREVPSDAGKVQEQSLKRPVHDPLRARLREQASSSVSPVTPERQAARRQEFEKGLSLFGDPNRIDAQIKAGIETHDFRAAKRRRTDGPVSTPSDMASSSTLDKDKGPAQHSDSDQGLAEEAQGSDQWVYSGRIGTLSQVKRIYKGDIRAISETTTDIGVVNALDELRNMAVKKGHVENDESFIRKWDEKANNGSEKLQALMRRLATHADA